MAATGILGDRFCVHKAEFDKPIDVAADGAGGSGALNRAFQFAGNCARQSESVRNHGCRRRAVFPSPQALISCGTLTENSSLYPQDAGCNGGNAYEAWRFFYLTGAPPMDQAQSSGCVPYTAGSCVTPGGDPNNDGCRKCDGLLDQCQDTGLPPPMYRVESYGIINQPPLPEREDPSMDRPADSAMAARERYIQEEIMANGPVLACIYDYHNFVDFFNAYPLGVYNSTEGSEAFGGHCMNMLGWGVDASSGMKYWLMRNTWGPAWGSNGVVRFKRGVDYLGIESDVWAACPAGAKHCQLTDGVDTSVMDMPGAAAAGLSRGGGHWLQQAPGGAIAQRAAATYVLSAAGDEDALAALEAGDVAPAEVLAAHGVSVRAASSQVVAGFKVRLELDVPEARVGALAPGLAAAPNAVRLLPPAKGALTDVVNNGCDTGAACAGRTASSLHGMSFCCKPGCGHSCSISISSHNGDVHASCACAASLQVELLHGPDGVVAPHGHALLL